MKCTEVRAALPLLIYGEPRPDEAALREHLAACPACRREQEAFQDVRRLLDATPTPRIEVDLPRLYQSLAERQTHRLRRWRGIALTLGALAALLLCVFGFRLHLRVEANQIVVQWGDPPPPVPAPVLTQPLVTQAALPPETEGQLRVLSELIHALKQDVEDRDERFADRLARLQMHVLALQSQADLRWNATEQDVAALYLLSHKKGEKQ